MPTLLVRSIKTRSLIRSTKVRHETGESLGIIPHPNSKAWNLELWYRQVAPQPEDNPPLKGTHEIFLTFFFGFPDRPHAAQLLYLGVKTLTIVNKLVFCLFK